MTETMHETYLSAFTWRYGSEEMRSIWSEAHNRRLWRRIWVALAEAQMELGLVTSQQVDDLRTHAETIDINRAHQIEADIKHDLMAEILTFAEQCPIGGGIIHLGATSQDIKDNADVLRMRDSLDIVINKLCVTLKHFATQIEKWANTPTMGFTHLQPAEPTTVGYRLAQYGFDLLVDLSELRRVRNGLRGKGIKGAVGTSSSFMELLSNPSAVTNLETSVMTRIDLEAFPVSTQTYPRKQDWLVLNAIAGLAASLYKFAFDLRILQSPSWGEWAEPKEMNQVGSSAMPFKRNPVNAENISSLARYLGTLPHLAWDNAAHTLLERTLDDSANRREMLPCAFLAADEILERSIKLIRDLEINEVAINRNLTQYGPFASIERILMSAVFAGADRQHIHEVLRKHSTIAWDDVQMGRHNPLDAHLITEPELTAYLSPTEIEELFDATQYTGNAGHLALNISKEIETSVMETRNNDLP